MASDFEIKQGDRLPPFRVQLMSGGAPLDLTTALGADFIMSLAPGGAVTPKVNAAAVIESPATSGYVRYDWVLADTDTIGQYVAEIEIHWPGSKDQTAPTDAYWTVEVFADLEIP